MKLFAVCLLGLVSYFSSYAQYNNPYRITYDGDNYYISNKGNGKITKLDKSFTKSSVISGLISPNDLFFGNVGGNDVLIILDDNKIKIYDTTNFAQAQTITIPNCLEAHDGAFNPSNANEFFISDRKGNKIIKGSIGAAPFYPITFSTLTSIVLRPAGMHFNQNNQLIVVSDTTNAQILEVNIANGDTTLLLKTGLDYLNDITQDSEENYYISCWGDDNIYRYSASWDNRHTVVTYNNPSGLYANLELDLLGLACTNCQKVDFKLFHLFSPSDDVAVCVADSFYVSTVPVYKGIGTYNSDNKFLVEMSNRFGNFDNPLTIGSVMSTTVPNSLKAAVPNGVSGDSGYLYRISSTSPAVSSYFSKRLVVHPEPEAKFIDGDSFNVCEGSDLELKINYVPNSTYSFFPPTGFSVKDSITFSFQSTTDSVYNYVFQEVNNATGCIKVNPFVIHVLPDLELPHLLDSLSMCTGDTLVLSRNNRPYIYSWEGTAFISSSSDAQPKFYGDKSTTVYLSISDSSNVCTSIDSVFVNVLDSLNYKISSNYTICEGDSISLGEPDIPYVFNWRPTPNLSDVSSSNPTFNGKKSEQLYVQYTDSSAICKDLARVYVSVNPKPNLVFTLQELEFCFGDTIDFSAYSDDSLNYSYSVSNSEDYTNGKWLANAAGRYSYTLHYSYISTGCTDSFGNGYGVSFIEDSIRLVNKGEYLESIVYADNRSNAISWYINGKWIALAKDTLNTNRLNAGDSIQVSISSVNGQCQKSSNVIVWKTLSVFKPEIRLDVFPNPSNGKITIETEHRIQEVSIYDPLGKLVYHTQEAANKLETKLPTGLYLLEVKTSSGIGAQRIVIQ